MYLEKTSTISTANATRTWRPGTGARVGPRTAAAPAADARRRPYHPPTRHPPGRGPPPPAVPPAPPPQHHDGEQRRQGEPGDAALATWQHNEGRRQRAHRRSRVPAHLED